MEKLLESYLTNRECLSKPKIKFINKDYFNSNRIIFTYSHEYSIDDLKLELNIWDLLEYTFNMIINR